MNSDNHSKTAAISETPSAEREKIVSRIKEALLVPAPTPGHGATHHAFQTGASEARRWLPQVGATFEDQLALFRKNALDLKATFHVVDGDGAFGELLLELRDVEGWKKVGAHQGELTSRAVSLLGLPICWTDKPYDVNELEKCDVGITECDALIAQTGSVLVTNRSAGGRALSVLPPHHLVLARKEQLVPDLPEAFALLKRKYAREYPSFISFITGPSRTGDIERILVLGAHGPRKLSILCV